MASTDRAVFSFLRARFDSRPPTRKMSEDPGKLDSSCDNEDTVEQGTSIPSRDSVANNSTFGRCNNSPSLLRGRESMRLRVSNVNGTMVSNRKKSLFERQKVGSGRSVEKLVSLPDVREF